MADFTQIIQEINDDINTNGVGAITGAKMNTVLKDMVSAVNIEKQDTISDLEDIRDGAAAGATAFQKPSDGIPATDMDENVQAALDNAENAVLYSEQSVGITDQQRNTALANVSNQTANSTTGKMGYKVLDPTKTFAQQVTAENTIYEIRDVFDLNGTQETPVSVTLPANSTLKFNGGIIKNGTINGNKTIIDADLVKIFDNVDFGGDWFISECYPEWFGANSKTTDTTFDNGVFINKALNAFTLYNPNVSGVKVPCVLSGSRYYTQTTIEVNSTTLIGKNKNTIIYATSQNCNPVVYAKSNSRIESIGIWGGGSSDRNVDGLWLGNSEHTISATRGEYRNICIQYCDNGVSLHNQWCNELVGFNVSRCNIGLLTGKTTPYIDKWNIEGNGIGIKTDFNSSGIKATKCVIEGNGKGCVLDYGECSFVNCYFEGNTESSVNENAEKIDCGTVNAEFLRDKNGGHIIAGVDNKLYNLSIFDCLFSNADNHNNQVYIDKCDNFYCNTNPDRFYTLNTTENCNIVFTPQINYDSIFRSNANPRIKSHTPIFECNDFRTFKFTGDTIVKLTNDSYYCKVTTNTSKLYIGENGHVYSYRTDSSQKRWINCQFTISNFCNREKDLCVVLDYVINQPKINLNCYCKLYGSSTKTLYSVTPTSSNGASCRNSSFKFVVSKEDLQELNNDDSFKYTLIDICINETTASTYVDAATDKSEEYCFKVTRFAIYEGSSISNDLCNNSSPFARLEARRIISKEGVILPVFAGNPTYPEERMTFIDSNTGKVVFRPNNTAANPSISADGRTNAISVGSTTQRPSNLAARDRGYEFYDLTLLKPVFYTNNPSKPWVDADGYTAGRKYGTTQQRPTLAADDIGYMYFDETLDKYICWNGTSWVNLDGTALS